MRRFTGLSRHRNRFTQSLGVVEWRWGALYYDSMSNLTFHGEGNVAIKPSSIGEYSTSRGGQGCLWTVALGVLGVLGFSYLSTYAGFPHDALDRVENGIAGVTRPAISRSISAGRARIGHFHRRARRRRVVYRSRVESGGREGGFDIRR